MPTPQLQDRLVILVPSRRKPEQAAQLLKDHELRGSTRSDLIFCLDPADGITDYPISDKPPVLTPWATYGQALERSFQAYPDYRLYMMGTDDMRIKDGAWLSLLFNSFFEPLNDLAAACADPDGPIIISHRLINMFGGIAPAGSVFDVWRWWRLLADRCGVLFSFKGIDYPRRNGHEEEYCLSLAEQRLKDALQLQRR